MTIYETTLRDVRFPLALLRKHVDEDTWTRLALDDAERELVAVERVIDAARACVILEYHPDYNDEANAELKRRADALRAALAALNVEETP